MKRFYLYIMMAVLLTACGHRTSNGNSADSDSLAVTSEEALASAFKTDSIGLEREDSMVSISISVDWPVKGNDSLVASIRQYICEELVTSHIQEGNPDITLYDDGKKAIEALADTMYHELAGYWKEAHNEGIPTDMAYSFYLHVNMQEENDLYVTYLSKGEGFSGGAHGYATASYQTFRRRDGLRIGYETEYDQKAEAFVIKNQTLFKDPKSPGLAALIKEGVRSYFKEFQEDVLTDDALKDMLIGVDDVNRIPVPNVAPSFTENGLAFIYQQYEIAPYAAGMINFDLPYDKVRPYLTKEAAELIK